MNNKQDIKDQILELCKEYYEIIHKPEPFNKDKDKVFMLGGYSILRKYKILLVLA